MYRYWYMIQDTGIGYRIHAQVLVHDTGYMLRYRCRIQDTYKDQIK